MKLGLCSRCGGEIDSEGWCYNYCMDGDKPMTFRVEKHCVITGKLYGIDVPIEGYLKWKDGMLIQNALPELSAGDREFLKTGISPEGWEEMFGEENE